MSEYKQFLNICKELKDIEKEVNAYNQFEPILSEKAFAGVQKLSKGTKKNRPDSSLSNIICGFWGGPNQENMRKLMQELLAVYYERKIKRLKNEEFFDIIDKALKR